MYDGPKITSGGASSCVNGVSAPTPQKALDELYARNSRNNDRLARLLDTMRAYADATLGCADATSGKVGRERAEPANRVAAVFGQTTDTDALIDGLEAQFNRIETI